MTRPRKKHTATVQEKYKDGTGYRNFHLSKKQQECVRVIQENTLSFVQGPAGTGKTLSILRTFVEAYLKDPTLQLVIIRTPVEAGSDSVGYLPSDLKAKLEPHFASTKLLLEQLLSPGKVECDMGKRIHFAIPNFQLGATWDNSLVLIDEAQQLQPMIMKLLLERIGKNSKVVVAGDPTQLYAKDKSRNGMTDALERFFEKIGSARQPNFDDIGYFEYTPDDCMRSEIVKSVLKAYQEV